METFEQIKNIKASSILIFAQMFLSRLFITLRVTVCIELQLILLFQLPCEIVFHNNNCCRYFFFSDFFSVSVINRRWFNDLVFSNVRCIKCSSKMTSDAIEKERLLLTAVSAFNFYFGQKIPLRYELFFRSRYNSNPNWNRRQKQTWRINLSSDTVCNGDNFKCAQCQRSSLHANLFIHE